MRHGSGGQVKVRAPSVPRLNKPGPARPKTSRFAKHLFCVSLPPHAAQRCGPPNLKGHPVTSATTPGPAPLTKPLLAFCGLLIVGQIVLGVLGNYVELPSSIGVIMLVAAAVAGGQTFGNSARRVMTPGEKVRFAIIGTIAAFAIGIAGLYATFTYYGVPLTAQNMMLGLGVPPGEMADFKNYVAIGLGIGGLISLIVLYVGGGFGSKSAVRALEKKGSL